MFSSACWHVEFQQRSYRYIWRAKVMARAHGYQSVSMYFNYLRKEVSLQGCCWQRDKTLSTTWNQHVSRDFAVCSVKQTTWSLGQRGQTDHNLILWYSIVWVFHVSAQTVQLPNSSLLLPWSPVSSGFVTCWQNIRPIRMRLLCIHGDEGADRVPTSSSLKFPAMIIMLRSTGSLSCNFVYHSLLWQAAEKWKCALDVHCPAKPLKPWQEIFTREDQPCWQHRMEKSWRYTAWTSKPCSVLYDGLYRVLACLAPVNGDINLFPQLVPTLLFRKYVCSCISMTAIFLKFWQSTVAICRCYHWRYQRDLTLRCANANLLGHTFI